MLIQAFNVGTTALNIKPNQDTISETGQLFHSVKNYYKTYFS